MTRTIASACALFIVALASFDAHAAVGLRLWVEPQSQLPAIEPSLRVEAVNNGSEPVELPRSVALQVIPPGDRKPFIAYTGLRGNDRVTWFHSGDDAASSIVLAAKETRDLSFWAGPESPIWFAADSRLLSPGTYRFQLVAHDELNSDSLEKLDVATDQPGLLDPVVSNEATYVVQTPQGEDAAVWELIKQLPSPTFWSDALGQRIWAEHPTSRYAAFCLNDPKATDPSASIAAYTAALEKQPTEAWADWYRLGIARDELTRASSFVDARDAEAALTTAKRAEAILTRLARESLHPHVRKEARELIDTRLWTGEGITRAIRIANGELKEARPFVVCVEKGGDGKHVFWFGYENTARERMKIPIGPDNKFTPPPFDRGQPTIFAPTYAVLGVRVVTDEPAVMWHLQNYNVHATLAKTQPCPADLQELYTYDPPERE